MASWVFPPLLDSKGSSLLIIEQGIGFFRCLSMRPRNRWSMEFPNNSLIQLEKLSKPMYTMACTQGAWSILPCRLVMLPFPIPRAESHWQTAPVLCLNFTFFHFSLFYLLPFYCHFTIPSPAVSLWGELGNLVLRRELVGSHFYLLVLLEIIFSCV